MARAENEVTMAQQPVGVFKGVNEVTTSSSPAGVV
jgi:hypothetical protein